MFKLTPNRSAKTATTSEVGQIGEKIAQDFLKNKGLKLIEANFNCRYGELDLIMADKDTLVFVEVKYRSSRAYGGALHAISPTKKKKLIRTALFYMQQKGMSNNPARFDVIAINNSGNKDDNEILWIENAFYAQ